MSQIHLIKSERFQSISGQRYRYIASDYSIESTVVDRTSDATLLVGDLQIALNSHGQLMDVYGLCPHPSWHETRLMAPLFECYRLQVVEDLYFGGGACYEANTNFKANISVDYGEGLICIGNPDLRGDFVCFSSGVVAVLHENLIASLWFLKVEDLPR